MGKRNIKIQLYDKKKSKRQILNYGGQYILDDMCISCRVQEDLRTTEYFLDAIFILDEEGRYKHLEEDAVLKVQMDYGDELFSIVDINKTMSRISVFARQITISESIGLWLEDVRPENKNGQDALVHMQEQAIGKKNLEFESDISLKNTAFYQKQSLYDAIHISENGFLIRWGGEVRRRGYKLIINEKLGENNGVQIRSGKNLVGFEAITNIDNVVTRIKPVGFNGITIEGYVNSPLINNYKYIRTQTIKYEHVKLKSDVTTESGAEESEDLVFDTLAEAQNKLTELALLEFANNIDSLEATYSLNLIDLSKTEEYKEFAQAELIQLGDEVNVYEEKHDINITVRVVRRIYDVLQQKAIEIELSNKAIEKAGISDPVKELGSRLDQVVENIGYMNVTYAKIKDLEATNLEVDNLQADVANIGNLKADKADINTLTAEVASIKELKANKADVDELTADVADIKNLKADKATVDSLTADVANIKDLKADKADISELNAGLANVENLVAKKADIEQLTAINAKIEDLEAGDFSAIKADIENLKADKADITDLNATVGKVGELEADIADIHTIVNNHMSSDNIQSLVITAIKTTTEEAFIKDAHINKVNANKIDAGTINTDNVMIQSDDGSMTLNGSLQKFKDENGKTRIQIGKDAKGNFSFVIYDETGVGQLITHEGIQSSDAIKDGIIVDSNISDDAAIQGSKLDINSVITSINEDGSETLSASKIKLDEEGRRLDVAFGDLTTTVSETQTQVESNLTSLTVAQGQITSLIETTNTVTGDMTELKNEYNSMSQTVDSNTTKIGSLTTKVNSVSSKQSTFEQTLDSFTTRVESMETNINATLKHTYTQYYLSASKTELIGDMWRDEAPTDVDEYHYVWQRMKYEYTDGKVAYGSAVCIAGTKGEQGAPGPEGPEGPQGPPGPEGPKGDQGEQGIQGNDGPQGQTGPEGPQGPAGPEGPQGIPGPSGKDGATLYTWIKYADDTSGTGMSNYPTGKKYIGIAYNKETSVESNNSEDYMWSQIAGDKGDQGVQGPVGPSGQAYYTWIKYSDNADGTGLYDTPKDSTKYIGIATNKTTQTESTNKADYTWSLFKGEQGEQGQPGAPGEPGKDGEKGQSLVSSTPQWYLSDSDTEQTGGSWVDAMPTIEEEKYLWIRYKQVWTNPSATTYTTPVLEQVTEAVKETSVKTAVLEQSLSGFSATVTELHTTVNDISDKQASLDLSVDGFVTEVRSSYYTKDDTNNLIDGVSSSTGQRLTAAESSIKQLADSISTLVVDEKGSSLMTQTSNGWVFNMSEINKTLENAAKELGDLSGNVDELSSTLSSVDGLINDLSQKTAYITMSTDDQGNPCIELGRANDEFKVRITNTAIEFMEGTNKVAYVNNQSLYIEKAVVKNELQIGEDPGWAFAKRSNGNLGLRWKGSGN